MGFERISNTLRVAAIVVAVAALAGCTAVGAVVGAGAGVGVAAYQERGIEGRAKDLKISGEVFEKFFSTDVNLNSEIGVEVYEGRVLLTGTAPNQALADKAVKLCWQIDDVKDVLNEIQVGTTGVTDYIRDSWITGQLRSKITFDEDVLAINYAIETVNGRIYLIGIAQNQKELDRVIAHANNIAYVRDVISHVRVKGDDRGVEKASSK